VSTKDKTWWQDTKTLFFNTLKRGYLMWLNIPVSKTGWSKLRKSIKSGQTFQKIKVHSNWLGHMVLLTTTCELSLGAHNIKLESIE